MLDVSRVQLSEAGQRTPSAEASQWRPLHGTIAQRLSDARRGCGRYRRSPYPLRVTDGRGLPPGEGRQARRGTSFGREEPRRDLRSKSRQLTASGRRQIASFGLPRALVQERPVVVMNQVCDAHLPIELRRVDMGETSIIVGPAFPRSIPRKDKARFRNVIANEVCFLTKGRRVAAFRLPRANATAMAPLAKHQTSDS